jgi:hypothetical protein
MTNNIEYIENLLETFFHPKINNGILNANTNIPEGKLKSANTFNICVMICANPVIPAAYNPAGVKNHITDKE